jgi:hypothetical protein
MAGRDLKKQFGDERAFLDDEVCRRLVYAASVIEPAITLETFRNSRSAAALPSADWENTREMANLVAALRTCDRSGRDSRKGAKAIEQGPMGVSHCK